MSESAEDNSRKSRAKEEVTTPTISTLKTWVNYKGEPMKEYVINTEPVTIETYLPVGTITDKNGINKVKYRKI